MIVSCSVKRNFNRTYPVRPSVVRPPVPGPLKHPLPVRYDERDMSMCIAAKAQYAGSPRIVLCCDTMFSDEYSSTEGNAKYDFLLSGFYCLWAGHAESAEQVLRVYKTQLDGVVFTPDNIRERLWAPMQEFNSSEKQRSYPINSRGAEVQLLFAGFLEGAPYIFWVPVKALSL